MSEEPLDVETVDETKPAAEPKSAEKSDGGPKAAPSSGDGPQKGGGRSWTAGCQRRIRTDPFSTDWN